MSGQSAAEIVRGERGTRTTKWQLHITEPEYKSTEEWYPQRLLEFAKICIRMTGGGTAAALVPLGPDEPVAAAAASERAQR